MKKKQIITVTFCLLFLLGITNKIKASEKVITDLILNYKFSEKISANIGVSNLLDVYPDEIDTKGDVATDLGGRFKYPWEVNQFGFNGTTINGGVTFKF